MSEKNQKDKKVRCVAVKASERLALLKLAEEAQATRTKLSEHIAHSQRRRAIVPAIPSSSSSSTSTVDAPVNDGVEEEGSEEEAERVEAGRSRAFAPAPALQPDQASGQLPVAGPSAGIPRFVASTPTKVQNLKLSYLSSKATPRRGTSDSGVHSNLLFRASVSDSFLHELLQSSSRVPEEARRGREALRRSFGTPVAWAEEFDKSRSESYLTTSSSQGAEFFLSTSSISLSTSSLANDTIRQLTTSPITPTDDDQSSSSNFSRSSSPHQQAPNQDPQIFRPDTPPIAYPVAIQIPAIPL